ncbi:MAG TPA: hypothetical protein VFK86_16400 [Bauldia sp.]|nr:hypothetical protein [Bauldia sp.]
MTIVLHIGTHKTGTTAIQRFAASKRAKLRRRGVWYPSYDEIGLFMHYGHHHVAHAIANEAGNRLSSDDARRFVDHILAKKRPGETLLISAEPFYRHILPAEGGYWAERRAYIERVRSFFPTSDVKILAIIRRQDTFARSLYQERIKVTKFRQTFREFIQSGRNAFEYYNHLSLFRDIFGRVEVLIYEDLAARGLIDAFFHHIGIDVSDIPERPNANPSLPIELVEFKRILNSTSLKPERLKEIGTILLDNADRVTETAPGSVDWLPVEEMAAFYESFAAENERLRSEFLPGRPPPLFPPFVAPAEPPAVYEGMSTRRFAHLAAELLL